ncbi:MAG: type II toxin-antitoxin system HicB family antitoxin [Hydrococcus sp. SU_1_0]|nr:type II toxin-antitoxin system HicB family antitoxin [Hydrococcus sp. SU_1_0]
MHKYQITIAWSQEDECYLAYLPDFAEEVMQPVTHGNTYQEALQHGLEVMEEFILHLQAKGKSLPVAKLVSA